MAKAETTAIMALAWCVGCAAAGTSGPASATRTFGPETEACRAARVRILADAEQSRQRRCVTDSDCALATNPGTRAPAERLVVFAEDHAGLEARASSHLQSCGEALRTTGGAAAATVEVHCTGFHCDAYEATAGAR